MNYGTVAGVAKPISRLVQGSVMLSPKRLDESFALLDAIYTHGGRAFDVAHNYGMGDCERALGSWIADRGVRDEVVILGKGAHPYGGRQRVTPEDIASDLSESLERMRVDFIDLYILHRDNPAVPVGPIVEALNEHHDAGTIGLFGGSNWSAARIAEANAYAAEHGLVPFAVSSPNFSLAVQIEPPWEGCLSVSGPDGVADRAWYREQDMPIFPWSSLAGGFFSGRVHSDKRDDFMRSDQQMLITSYGSEENFQRLARAETLARHHDATVPQIALAYVVNQSQPIFPLVGCRTGDEFAANVAALDLTLTPAELDWLDLTTDEMPPPS
ncbi:MAG: aldo/keto reductase [Chloroflexia bacterium]|nr:aldo/keto reductase [Chloroflexia bacterium]